MLAFDLSTETSTDYRTMDTLRGTFESEDGTTVHVIPAQFLPSVFDYRESNHLKNLSVRHEVTGVVLIQGAGARTPEYALFDLQSPVRGRVEIFGIDRRTGNRTWSTMAEFGKGYRTLTVNGTTFVRTGRGKA